MESPIDRPNPTIRQIQYFVAVAELASFRRAAERVGVSQPTLSQQVLAFEAAVGVQLFERSRAGTTLTPAAREMLPAARRVLEHFEELRSHAESLSRGPAGTYRLGVTPTLGPYLLPQILPGLHRQYSALKLYIREDAPRDLEAGLVSGAYDLILTALPVDAKRLKIAPLFHEPLELVMSSEHRLAKKRRIVRQDLAGESVLTIEDHHLFHRQILELCDRLGAHMLRDYEGTSLDTLREMVVMGMGIAFLPRLYVRSEIHRPLRLRVARVHGEQIRRTHALVWRDSSPSRQLFQEIADVIRARTRRVLAQEVEVIEGKPVATA